MKTSRRNFLKTASAAAAGAPLLAARHAPARAAAREGDPDLPRGLTLATIRRHNQWRLAVRTRRGLLDVAAAREDMDIDAPTSIDELFARGGGNALTRLAEAAVASERAGRWFLREDEAEFGPCVTNPEKILCVGLNYWKHAQEMGAQPPGTPMLFNKYNNALMGHRGVLRLPTKVARAFDYEVELVVVIGRSARDIGAQQALSYVAGYCTGNDMSARDLQRKTSQFMLGKTCDGFAPIGPWLVGADQVPDPNALDLWCEVNGERRQSSNTRDMVFSCAELVSYASQHMTLKPGDIIFTGTPEGVIAGRKPEQQAWLKPGDRIRCGIEPLGALEFTLA
ncbi:MAG TPA: fumarylacetoacetate hydrolase family protein [Burkholderiales bacterium]|nr:fumarylacetoacetate hydrolase family protein [Burkholderiales bacterium]